MRKHLPLIIILFVLAGCSSIEQTQKPRIRYDHMWDGVRNAIIYPIVGPPIAHTKFVVPELRKDPEAVIEHLIVNLEISGTDDKGTVDKGTVWTGYDFVVADTVAMSHWMLDRCLEHDMKFFPDDIYRPDKNQYMPEVYYLNNGRNRQRIAKMWRDYWEENKSRMYWDEKTRRMRLAR